jgi:protein ImuB
MDHPDCAEPGYTGQETPGQETPPGELACVELPQLALQLLLRDNPSWQGQAVALLDQQHPQGNILALTAAARRRHAAPGQRYASALSLLPDLRAGTVEAEQISRAVEQVTRLLDRFTPGVEPSTDTPGLFWLDASGLDRLYPDTQSWLRAIDEALLSDGWEASSVAGFSRFGTRALAGAGRRALVLNSPDEERRLASRITLDRLGLPPALVEKLEHLGVRSVGAFLRLPAAGIKRRFGHEVARLHALADDRLWNPLQPTAVEIPCSVKTLLDQAVDDSERLLFILQPMLKRLLAQLASRGRSLRVLHLMLQLDDRSNRLESLHPATATLDVSALMELLTLRLGSGRLPAAVSELEIRADTVKTPPGQAQLPGCRSGRDLEAANRALARVRAELGEAAVTRAALREAHLPEASWTWLPLGLPGEPGLQAAEPRQVRQRPLLRRVSRPRPIAPRPPAGRDWYPLGADSGAVRHRDGPYLLSGGWWAGDGADRGVQREYWFAQTEDEQILWIYFDNKRNRWFLHGRVE